MSYRRGAARRGHHAPAAHTNGGGAPPPRPARPPHVAHPPDGWSAGNFEKRIRLVRVVLAAAMLLVVARLIDVQVIHSGKYQTAALNESHEQVTLDSLRGGIYSPRRVASRSFCPHRQRDRGRLPDCASWEDRGGAVAVAGCPGTTLASELHRRSGYVVLASQLSQSDGQKIAADAIPGITLVAGSKRVVTNGDLASPVLGYTNGSNNGAAGIEYAYNRQLAGTAGKETLIESPSGVALPESTVADRVASNPGQGLELTLDTQLQYESEQALAQAIESSQALSGTAILMDVKTGQILSMANLVSTHPPPVSATPPTVEQRRRRPSRSAQDAVNEATNNTAVTQLYEPGSVFKLVTFSAAPAGRAHQSELPSSPCPIRSTWTARRSTTPSRTRRRSSPPPRSWPSRRTSAPLRSRGTGGAAPAGAGQEPRVRQIHRTRLSGGIARADRYGGPMGADRLRVAAHRAGGRRQRTPGPRCLQRGGQRGTFVQPKLVEATVDQSGGVTATAPSPTHRVSTRDRLQLTTMLEQVVSDGTGTSAVVPGYSGGQDRHGADPDHGQGRLYRGCVHGLLRGVRPAVNPTFSMIVVLDRPTPIFGGTVAAPVFSQIMSYALHRYDIPTTAAPPARGQRHRPPAARRRTSHEPVPSAGRRPEARSPRVPPPCGRPCELCR